MATKVGPTGEGEVRVVRSVDVTGAVDAVRAVDVAPAVDVTGATEGAEAIEMGRASALEGLIMDARSVRIAVRRALLFLQGPVADHRVHLTTP